MYKLINHCAVMAQNYCSKQMLLTKAMQMSTKNKQYTALLCIFLFTELFVENQRRFLQLLKIVSLDGEGAHIN